MIVEYFALGGEGLNGGLLYVYLTSIKEITKCDGKDTVHLVILQHITTPDCENRIDESVDRFIFVLFDSAS